MIISFKYKFIFIKNYKTAGSSIETYLYNYLTLNDIAVGTIDFKGINNNYKFEDLSLFQHFEPFVANKQKNKPFFTHMPAWLLKKRLEIFENILNCEKNIFSKFYKFAVIRNPFDLIVSDYHWNNDPSNPLRNNHTFDQIIREIEEQKFDTFRLFNLNRICSFNHKKILVDRVIKFENLNEELSEVFNYLSIPFNGKLEIFKKRSVNRKHYRKYYQSNHHKKVVMKHFSQELDKFGYYF